MGGLGAFIRIENRSYLSHDQVSGVGIEPGHATNIYVSRSFRSSLPRPYSQWAVLVDRTIGMKPPIKCYLFENGLEKVTPSVMESYFY